jgi:hypothetical protein
LAAIAISDSLSTAINNVSGATDKMNKNFQTLLGTAGNTNRSVGELTHSLGKMAEANAEALSLSHIWTDWGKKIQIVGFTVSRPIEDIDKAFRKLLQTSPEVAKRTLADWKLTASALDKNSQQYKDNIMLIDRYTKMLTLQGDAQKGLAQVLEDENEATEKAAKAKAQAEERTKALADAQDKLKTKVTASANALQTKLGSALSVAKANLEKARQEFEAYSKSISSAVTGSIGFGSAQQTAADNIKAVRDATAEVADAQTAYNSAQSKGDPDATAEAYKRLTQAQQELAAVQSSPKTFMGALQAQETSAKSFAGNIQKLLDLGANQGVIDQLAASGAVAGNAIALEILGSSDPANYVSQINTIVSSTQAIADQVGTSAAAKFKQAGVDSATALLTGMNEVLSKAKIQLKFGNLNKKGKPIKTLRDLKDQLQNDMTGLFTVGGFNADDVPQLADGGVVRARSGGTLALLGEGGRDEAVIPLPKGGGAMSGGGIYVTVNAGVGDPIAIGAALVDVLQKYQSRTGSLPLKVR